MPLATDLLEVLGDVVTDFDEQQHRAAYEAMAKGDLQPIGALMHADHVHHMVSMGISARGRERTLELVSRMFDRLQVSDYRVSQVMQHGEFVVTCISGRSALRPDEFHGVDVVRVGPDGLAVEGWSHRPLLPDGIDARQLLDWQD